MTRDDKKPQEPRGSSFGVKPPKSTASGGKGKVFDSKGNRNFKSGAFAKGGDGSIAGGGGNAMPLGNGGYGGDGMDGGDAAASSQSEEHKAIGGFPGQGGPPGFPNGGIGNDGVNKGVEEYF